jgi:oligoendopeptidase F
MNRRDFIQTTGLTAAAAATLAARSAVAVAAEAEAEEAPVKRLPLRSEVKESDTWDLSKLFPNDKAWEEAFVQWTKKLDGYAAFRGHLGDSAEKLAECIAFDLDLSRAGDRLGVYAHLKVAEDQANSVYQRMMGRFMQAASKAGQQSAFIRPEILAIPAEKMDEYLASPELAPYKLLLQRIIRFKPHTLGAKEERLLAMLGEFESTPAQIFHQLADTDVKFGAVKNEKGEAIELSNGSFTAFLNSSDRNVRKTAFHQFYAQYKAHEHTFAGTFAAAVTRDTFNARARNFKSALEGAMFPDNVPVTVFDNLIASVHRALPSLYHYYDVRQRKMGLKDIHFYDIYAPILANKQTHRTWDQAVDTIEAALAPLGSEYVQTIAAGLRGRWCDRYENRGKQSGAFSQGCYDGDPHILISYQPDVLDSMFTLAHEGGHSMHSYLSCKNQPYAYFEYTLFVAEVASTFNETLLSRYLIEKAQDKQERAFILNHEIDSMRATIFRQTMFADFEKMAHASAESGEPLTLDRIKQLYNSRLKLYFGPNFALDADLDLECFRIPHFYRTFYVYKYATALSAAIALVERVTSGGKKELDEYLTFLKGGCSKDPLDLLRGAGVDLEQPGCVDAALVRFDKLVKELDSLI